MRSCHLWKMTLVLELCTEECLKSQRNETNNVNMIKKADIVELKNTGIL